MADSNTRNKVVFGVKKLTFWPLTAAGTDSAAPTYGEPISVPGTRKIAVNYDGEQNTFYADDIKYWEEFSQSGNSGSIENAMLPDELKVAAYGWRVDSNGGLVEVEGGKPGHFAMGYEIDGDAKHRRVIHYDVTLGMPNEEHNTAEKSKSPDTQSVDWSGTAQNISGELVPRYSLPEGSTGYDGWFTSPVMPAAAQS